MPCYEIPMSNEIKTPVNRGTVKSSWPYYQIPFYILYFDT